MFSWSLTSSQCPVCRAELYDAELPQGPPPAPELCELFQLPDVANPLIIPLVLVPAFGVHWRFVVRYVIYWLALIAIFVEAF